MQRRSVLKFVVMHSSNFAVKTLQFSPGYYFFGRAGCMSQTMTGHRVDITAYVTFCTKIQTGLPVFFFQFEIQEQFKNISGTLSKNQEHKKIWF